MRKALVIGIDNYEYISPLKGCVNDARSVTKVLSRHGNVERERNFHVREILSPAKGPIITRNGLREKARQLFEGDGEVALFYFAGHGYVEATGGYLCASDHQNLGDGVSLNDILTFANNSRFRNNVVILDSCQSGIAGERLTIAGLAELSDGMTILTASTTEQYASEENGSGVFTGLLVDALRGAACNLTGDITPGSVYAHIDQSLGPWSQRPVFKTNVKRFVSLRKVDPLVPVEELRKIAEFFPTADYRFPLDPSFEPERQEADAESLPPPDARNTAVFKILQKYNRQGLLVPVDAPHMWHAAIHSKGARLTPLGEHYRRLVKRDLI
jgi:hypothetical protein